MKQTPGCSSLCVSLPPLQPEQYVTPYKVWHLPGNVSPLESDELPSVQGEARRSVDTRWLSWGTLCFRYLQCFAEENSAAQSRVCQAPFAQITKLAHLNGAGNQRRSNDGNQAAWGDGGLLLSAVEEEKNSLMPNQTWELFDVVQLQVLLCKEQGGGEGGAEMGGLDPQSMLQSAHLCLNLRMTCLWLRKKNPTTV